MATYRYTRLGSDLPAIPIMPIELTTPGQTERQAIVGQGIIDTGSDCTLIPIPWLIQVNAQVADRLLRIPVGGRITPAIPYEVGLRFDRYRHLVFRVYGCPIEDIGDIALIGRDLLNLYRVEFDGAKSVFTIY
jgi:hypothetical protein